MTFASLTLSAANWLVPVALASVALLGLLVWSYRAAPSAAVRWGCVVLKLLGFAALAFCLLEPLWSDQRVRPGANLFAVVADNSQGLQIKDGGATRSRGEELRELLSARPDDWQAKLAEDFEVRRFLFDSRLQNSRDFTELEFDGRASAIGAALRSLTERYQGRPLAGVLLFTDGNATDLRGTLPDIPGLPPVYPVVIGGRQPAKDVSLQQVTVNQSAFEDAPVMVQADVAASGFGGVSLAAQVVDRSGQVVQETALESRREGESAATKLKLKPEKPGLSFYELRVGTRDELKAGLNETNSAEATLANNHRVLAVDRGRDAYRILYVAGRPNWEFKFLNRAVTEEPQLQLVGLIRVARREPKFDFRGRAGETSNPLFRGFGEQGREEAGRYDQPVLVRLNTRDELELRSGFPRTPEELYGYHAVIVDDVEAEFFGPDQALLLQKFVSERGGGFLMLGGAESFHQGKYHRTPIGDMLPVYLERSPEPQPGTAVKFQLAREGWLQPWARVRDNETDERARLLHMPAFQVLNPVREIKPGASVVGTVTDAAGKEHPALVTQRFGRGRSAALTVGDVWRWGMQDAEAHTDMDKTWRQLLRWLVSDVPNRVDVTSEPIPDDPNGAVRVEVRVRDAKFQPLDNASVSVEVEPVLFGPQTTGATNSVRLSAEPSLSEAGLYQVTYVPRVTGGFKAAASVTNSLGAPVGKAEAGWSTDLAAEEFKSLTPNVALLETIAKKTGGEVVTPDRLAELVKKLPTQRAPMMEAWSRPIWHTPLLFAFALACLVAEWGLRRWKGMP
jgi:uncharacterized membrane protein